MKLLLFKNKSENPKAPHMSGYIINENNEKKFSIDVLANTSAQGLEYISGNVKEWVEPEKKEISK
jgi:hypothetical protein